MVGHSPQPFLRLLQCCCGRIYRVEHIKDEVDSDGFKCDDLKKSKMDDTKGTQGTKKKKIYFKT